MLQSAFDSSKEKSRHSSFWDATTARRIALWHWARRQVDFVTATGTARTVLDRGTVRFFRWSKRRCVRNTKKAPMALICDSQ
jgi:hypothetical protein